MYKSKGIPNPPQTSVLFHLSLNSCRKTAGIFRLPPASFTVYRVYRETESVQSRNLWLEKTTIDGGWQKFLSDFDMIGPLALRPCALLCVRGFTTYGMSCARPCALLRSPAFLMPEYHALKSYLPRRCD